MCPLVMGYISNPTSISSGAVSSSRGPSPPLSMTSWVRSLVDTQISLSVNDLLTTGLLNGEEAFSIFTTGVMVCLTDEGELFVFLDNENLMMFGGDDDDDDDDDIFLDFTISINL